MDEELIACLVLLIYLFVSGLVAGFFNRFLNSEDAWFIAIVWPCFLLAFPFGIAIYFGYKLMATISKPIKKSK